MTVDLHTLKASELFHVPADKVTKEQRRFAKAVNFASFYGTWLPVAAVRRSYHDNHSED